MTGTFIGTGAMVATSAVAPSPTHRFSWLTDAGQRSYRIDKFLNVARTVMGRRDKELDETTESVLRKLADA